MKFHLLLILISSILFFRCSSVTKIEGQTFRLEKPYVKEVNKTIDSYLGEEVAETGSDYKIRRETRKIPHYAIMPLQFPEGLNDVLIKLLSSEVAVLWASTNANKFEVNTASLNEECKKNEIDALIYPTLTIEEEKWVLSQKVIDPVNKTVYGTLQNVLNPYVPEISAKKETFKQVEIYHDGKSYTPVKSFSAPDLLWEGRPGKIEMAELLMKSIAGVVSIGSTSSETDFLLDNVNLGKLPIKDLKITDGMHVVAYVKPGKKPVTKELVIRGGENRNLFYQWDDDVSDSALRITSYPPGIKIALDGSVKGETPYFENELSRGKLSIEFLLAKKNNSGQTELIVLGEQSLETIPGRSFSMTLPYKMENSFIKDFWSPTGGDGFTVNLGDGISLGKKDQLDAGWYGIISESILPDVVSIEAVIGEEKKIVGDFSISLFATGGKQIFTIEVKKERVSIYKFPSDGIALGTYNFKQEDSENPRKVKFVTNKKDALLKIYLGNTRVLETKIDFKNPWKIGILTRGEDFSASKVIHSMKIEYPELLKQFK